MIQSSTRNQIGNSLNPYQGDTKKVLTVCSAGLLRSATMQNWLIKEYGYNVRNCGTARDFALIPISEALIRWADEIIFMNGDNFIDIEKSWDENMLKDTARVITLCIQDSYGFNDPNLIEEISRQYKAVQEAISSSGELYFTVEKCGSNYKDLRIINKPIE